jgi:hypothetical protein
VAHDRLAFTVDLNQQGFVPELVLRRHMIYHETGALNNRNADVCNLSRFWCRDRYRKYLEKAFMIDDFVDDDHDPVN